MTVNRFVNSSDHGALILDKAHNAAEYYRANGEARKGDMLALAADELVLKGNDQYMRAFRLMRRVPVTIEEFIESEDFLGNLVDLWPAVREDVVATHPDWLTGAAPILTTYLGGSTGSGKSFIGQIGTSYRMYWLDCFKTPQLLFPGLNQFTPILLMLQSVQERVTKRVLYEPIRQMFLEMPYAKRWIDYDKRKDNVLILSSNVELVPALASINTFLGSAVIGGILDEVNFMQVVESSKQIAGPRGMGGKFDQAQVVFDTLFGRIKSRFLTNGPQPAGLFVSSSVHYEDDFLERQIKQTQEINDVNARIVRRARYEAMPPERFSGETFRFLVGTDRFPPRILEDSEEAGVHYEAGAEVRDVPAEYKTEFQRNPNQAQRDILGIASSAIDRFMVNTHAITESVVRWRAAGCTSFLEDSNLDLLHKFRMPTILEDNLPGDLDAQRFVHVDLSISSDRCGIAMVKLIGTKTVKVDQEGNEVSETLPCYEVEMAVSLKPSGTVQIDIAAVRRWVIALRDFYGFNIFAITYDGFQSTESIQALQREGFYTGLVSMDRTMEPYEVVRDAIYSERLDLCDNDIARFELATLEIDRDKKKIDHPPNGSKDIADAIAGAVFTASKSRIARRMVNRETGYDPKKKRKSRKKAA